MKKIYLVLLLPIISYCCNHTSADKPTTTNVSFDISKVKESIEASNKKFIENALKGDSIAIRSIYTNDAKVYPPNMKEGNGDFMASYMAAIPKLGYKSFDIKTTDVTGNNDFVVETGTWEISGGANMKDNGKYINIWKQENGQWKIWHDMWNSDNPVPEPSPTKSGK